MISSRSVYPNKHLDMKHLVVVVASIVAASALSVSRPEKAAKDDVTAKLLGIGVVGLPAFATQAFTVTVVETVSAQTTVTTDCALMVNYCTARSSLGRGETPTIEPTVAILIATPPSTITGETFISSSTNDETANSQVQILDSSIDETVHTTRDFAVKPIVAVQTPLAAETPTHTLAIDSPQESPRNGDLIIPASAVTLEEGEHRGRRRCFEGVNARLLTLITVTSTSIAYTGTIIEENPTLTIEYFCTTPTISPPLQTCTSFNAPPLVP